MSSDKSPFEMLRYEFIYAYKAWIEAIHAGLPTSTVLAFWDKYVQAREAYVNRN